MKIIVVLDISFFLVYAVFNAGLRIKDNKIYGKKIHSEWLNLKSNTSHLITDNARHQFTINK